MTITASGYPGEEKSKFDITEKTFQKDVGTTEDVLQKGIDTIGGALLQGFKTPVHTSKIQSLDEVCLNGPGGFVPQ